MSAPDRPLPDIDSLPVGEFAFPGPLRERLVAAILAGQKTTTSHLLEEDRRFGEPLPRVGDLEAVVDSQGRRVCITRVTAVEVLPLAEVDDDHARREGEGYADAAAWRRGHERFWRSDEYLAEMGDPPPSLDDQTPVVCTRFEVLGRS